MPHFTTSLILLATIITTPTILAAVNGPCTLSTGAPGVCLHTSACSIGGGTSTSGFCPDDPADVKCCTKPSCGSGTSGSGDCRWTSSCTGTTLSGQCPGPASFKCCVAKSGGGGGGGGGGGSGGGASVTKHDLSDNGAAFIAGFEGFRANFYRDAAGVKTIGYGHACQPDSECNSISAPITRVEGQKLLKSDAAAFVSCINSDVKVPKTIFQVRATRNVSIADNHSFYREQQLNQNQFDALVSFTYNLGCGNLEDIAAYLNKNDFSGATSAMKEYTHAGGKVLQGLVTRRNKEVELFNS